MRRSLILFFCLMGLVIGPDKATAAARLLTSETLAPSSESPVIVTSDTLDYCKTLAHKVRRTLHEAPRTPAPTISQIMFLEHEGERLCANGHLRTGIAQERRALVVLMRS